MAVVPEDPRRYVVHAGRTGPYRFFTSDMPAVHYPLLAVASLLVGWMLASVIAPWTVPVTSLVYGAAIAVAVLIYFAAWDLNEWWRGEVHFHAGDDAVVCWYGTHTRRGRAWRFARGTEIIAVVVPGAIEQLSLVAGNRAFTFGRMWDVYPREFERWQTWVRGMGWGVDSSAVDADRAARDDSPRVGADWLVLPLAGEAASVWIIPHGPSSASYLAEERNDWLPEENVPEQGESFAPADVERIECIALRIASTLEGGEGVVEFGAAAAVAAVLCGGELVDVAFEDAVDASQTRVTPEGTLEVTFRRAPPQGK